MLKQLVATIGRDAFRDGIRTYFRRHAWGNATLADFLAALGDAAGRSLDDWAEVWLRTASLNTIEARWTELDGRIASMTLHQTAPSDHPTLRPHALTIALVAPELGGDAITTQDATISGPTADVPAVVGLPAPAFVFPNHLDHDYAKVSLDPASLAFAREHVREMDDPFLRQMVWSSLWDMVRDARLRSVEYLAMVRQQAPHEPDISLLDAILDHGLACLRRFVPETLRAAESHALVLASLDSLADGDTDDDRRLWLRLAIEAAASADDVATMVDVVLHPAPGTELPVDQDMRWQVAVRAASMGLPESPELVALEAERDRSDRGQRQRIRAEVARPLRAGKDEAWRRIHDEGYGSDYLTRAALSGFQWHHQRDLLVPYREPFFERIRGIYRDRDLGYARAYLASMFPAAWAEQAVLERARALIAELGPDEVQLRRHTLEICDDLERAIRVRAYAESDA